MEHFSDRLRHARKQRNLSQAELARASGLSQGAISSYETGSRRTTTGLVQLAQALKVSPVWLITGTGAMELDPIDSGHQTSTSRIKEIQPRPIQAAWPFSRIEPADYWGLPDAQRRIIEKTVAAMISAMGQKHDNR